MPRRKSIVILPHLIDAGGDITKKWCVEYSMRNPRSDQMQRFRNYSIFTATNSAKERYEISTLYIQELTEKIKAGWSPFVEQSEKVIYEDELMYSAVAENFGRLRQSNRCVRTYLSNFLSEKKLEVNKKSYQTYQSKMRSFNSYLEKQNLADLDISVINRDMIKSFLVYKVEEKRLARITVNKYQQIIFSFFEFLIEKNIVTSNPVTNMPVIGYIKDNAPYPIPSHTRDILGEAIKKKDRQLWLACCMMYYSAIRPGEEIRLLKVGDISFDSRKILVKSETSKTDRTEAIDMPDQLYDELIYHRIDLDDPDLYVFGKYGRPGTEHMGKNTLRNRFNSIRDDLNLSHSYKFYSWKHSGAEALADSGASTWEIQAHLRHRSIETTERYTRKRLGNRNARFKNDFPNI